MKIQAFEDVPPCLFTPRKEISVTNKYVSSYTLEHT